MRLAVDVSALKWVKNIGQAIPIANLPHVSEDLALRAANYFSGIW